jgi:hypothetical protein
MTACDGRVDLTGDEPVKKAPGTMTGFFIKFDPTDAQQGAPTQQREGSEAERERRAEDEQIKAAKLLRQEQQRKTNRHPQSACSIAEQGGSGESDCSAGTCSINFVQEF